MDESGFESETLRPFGYAPIGKPCIDSYNWKGKNEPTSLVLYIKKRYLRLITLSKTLTAAYSITGVNTR